MSTANLHCVVIGAEIGASYAHDLTLFPFVGEVHGLPEYPDEARFARMLRLDPMDLLVLDCSDISKALRMLEMIRSQPVRMEVLAVCREEIDTLRRLMQAGIREYVAVDSPEEVRREVLRRCLMRLQERPERKRAGGDIVAFLPAKPGCGASTIAAHAAAAAARVPDRRVLLSDFDRDAPMQAFLHKIVVEHHLTEALFKAPQMDEDLWSQLRTQRGPLDVLPALADGRGALEPVDTLLGFLRRVYDLTCIDLPGSFDPASVEVVQESKRVYVVCTQELAAVHLAIGKVERLRRLGLGREVRILCNRFDPESVMTEERIVDLTDVPVEMTFPNSYAATQDAAARGVLMGRETPLGRRFAELGSLLLDQRLEIPQTKRRFLEFLYQPFLGQARARN